MAKKRSAAIACPSCGAIGHITDVRGVGVGYVRRRYRCTADSSHRWTTMEVFAKREKASGIRGSILRPVDYWKPSAIFVNEDK